MRWALRAEWTKLRTTPGPIWLLSAIVVLTVFVGTAAAATLPGSPGEGNVDRVKVSLTGVQLGQAIVAILAVLVIGTEYSTGMIATTLTAVPRRTTVLAAKATVLTGVVTAAATIAVLGSLLAGRLVQPGHGYRPPSLADGPVLRAAVGSVCYLTLIALLGLGVTTAVRDSASAIGIVLGLLYVYPIIIQVVSDPHLQRRLQQIGPMSAGLAVQTTTHLSSLPISPWRGLGVLAAWAATALLTGGVLLQRRDA